MLARTTVAGGEPGDSGDVVLEPGSVGGEATFTVVLPASPETAPCLVRQS